MPRKPLRPLDLVGPKNLLGPESSACPTRVLLDQLADKWALLVLLALATGSVRFNALKREVEGITQKMLGQTLRRLEWNGLVERRAFATMPMTVEYELTPLAGSLMPIVQDLRTWSMANIATVAAARARFERSRSADPVESKPATAPRP